MTKDAALKLALDALETELCIDWTNNDEFNASAEKMHEAIAAIKEALVQPEQEAVGSVVTYYDSLTHGWFGDPPPEGTLLYIVPPQRPWVGLTNSEADNIISYPWGETKNWIKAIEATLKEKNA